MQAAPEGFREAVIRAAGTAFQGVPSSVREDLGYGSLVQLLQKLKGPPPPLPAAVLGEPTPVPQEAPTALLPLLPAPSELVRQLPLICANPDCWKPLIALALQPPAGAALCPLQLCGRCGAAAYCSRACQTAHWRQGHKEACAELRELGVHTLMS